MLITPKASSFGCSEHFQRQVCACVYCSGSPSRSCGIKIEFEIKYKILCFICVFSSPSSANTVQDSLALFLFRPTALSSYKLSRIQDNTFDHAYLLLGSFQALFTDGRLTYVAVLSATFLRRLILEQRVRAWQVAGEYLSWILRD
jgi:hypothetical protein